MKKKLIRIIALTLIFLMAFPFTSFASYELTPEEVVYYAQGTIIDYVEDGDYYVMKGSVDDKSEGVERIHYVDNTLHAYGEYTIDLCEYAVKISDIENGLDEFLGVKVSRIKPLFREEWLESGRITVYSYHVDLEDVWAGDEAEAIWSENSAVWTSKSSGKKAIFPYSYMIMEECTYIDGDINKDNTVDVFDYFMVKSICLETYEPIFAEEIYADYNKDGTIDVFDYAAVKEICFQ